MSPFPGRMARLCRTSGMPLVIRTMSVEPLGSSVTRVWGSSQDLDDSPSLRPNLKVMEHKLARLMTALDVEPLGDPSVMNHRQTKSTLKRPFHKVAELTVAV